MKGRTRIYYTEEQKARMWDRWQRGDSLATIARLFDRGHSSVQRILQERGGIRPPPRRRSGLALRLSEREEISRGVVAGDSIRSIAASLGRSASSVSREIQRNGGRGRYRASQADQAAWDRAQRSKPCKLALNRALARSVAQKLKGFWSPEQIAGWLKRTYPDDENNPVSHETIYRSLFIQARGALKKALLQYLRSQRAMRRSRHKSLKGEGLGMISDTVSIRERPASAEDRAVPGHWEGDLIFGSRNSQIATLVERHTRYVMLAKVSGKDTETVINALIKQAHKLPRELYKSLTWDRGKEMADHQRFTLATDIQVYFCDPQSPWQRGSNENTNGLLRQYFPKGTDLSVHSQAKLNAVARQLNERPRKTLDYETPAERFSQCVASIG
jgi:IS30 family transposase